MSTTIGAAWKKTSESGTEYISISLNRELLPLTIKEDTTLMMFKIPEKDRKDDLAPTYHIVLDKKRRAE